MGSARIASSSRRVLRADVRGPEHGQVPVPGQELDGAYCQDWNPEDWPSVAADLGVFAGRHRAQHVPGVFSCSMMRATRDEHLEGRLESLGADRGSPGPDLVHGQLHRQFGRLVLDDEQHLVMRRRQRLSGRLKLSRAADNRRMTSAP